MPLHNGLMNYADLEQAYSRLPDDQLDRLIDWKAGSVAVLKRYKLSAISEGAHMQRSYTIELRVDFDDPGKLPAIKQTLLIAARSVMATALLISENPKATAIAIHSEDWFSGKEEIMLMDDLLAQGNSELASAGDTQEAAPMSDELLGAFK